MKAMRLMLLSSLFILSFTNVANANDKDPIEVCSNQSASVRIIATQRDSGADYKNLKANRELYKIESSANISGEKLIVIAEKTPFLKPSVLSNAFASACMKDQSKHLDSDYYKQFEICNVYVRSEELVFKCVTNIVGY